MRLRDSSVVVVQTGMALGGLLLWEFSGRLSRQVFFLIGTPAAVLRELVQLLRTGELWIHLFTTGLEALLGLTIGTLVGAFFGLCLWLSDRTARVLHPYLLAAASLPVFAVAPLMIVWFGVGLRMKVALAALLTFFATISQAQRGTKMVAAELVVTLKGLGATRAQVFRKAVVPGSMSHVLGAMRLNVGLGLLGAFIGEFIAADKGLGYLLLRATGLYNVPRAFAAALGIIALALLFDWLGRILEDQSARIVQFVGVPKPLWSHTD